MSLDVLPAAFSPTASETASFCMRKWGFYKAGYKPRVIQYPQICAFVGTGFAAGAAYINRGVQRGESPASNLATAVSIAQAEASLEAQQFIDAGATIAPKDEKTWDAMPHLIELAVTLFVKKYPHEGTIVEVEKSYPNFGYARMDILYTRRADNRLVVNDYKVKVKLQPQWVNKEIERYNRSHQLYEYMAMTGAAAYEITLIILAPEPKIKVISYEVDREFAMLWSHDTQMQWNRMAEMKHMTLAQLPGSLVHEDKWGPCPYSDACLRGRLDTADLALDYIKVERRTHDNAD